MQVNRILIKPLSRITNDSGAVEDIHKLVAYGSQIDDLLDTVAEYFEFVRCSAELKINPPALNAFRANPSVTVIAPTGFEK